MKYPTPALWRIKVESVHDGDTLKGILDRGYEDESLKDIRLKDVWAPELNEPFGFLVRDYIFGWLSDHTDGSEWPFELETFRTPKSDVEIRSFNRYIGVVTAADGAVLNEDVTAFINSLEGLDIGRTQIPAD